MKSFDFIENYWQQGFTAPSSLHGKSRKYLLENSRHENYNYVQLIARFLLGKRKFVVK